MSDEHKNEHHNKLGVAVVTTSGRWPTAGFEKVQSNEKVRRILQEAARHLHLASTDDWIATVGSQTINVNESFRANGFSHGDVLIDFGPRQGGGGGA